MYLTTLSFKIYSRVGKRQYHQGLGLTAHSPRCLIGATSSVSGIDLILSDFS